VVIRLNVYDDVGRAVGSRYGVSALPTFLVFKGDAGPGERFVGFPDRDKLVRALLGS
jgi:hypothetical protein